VLSLGSVADKRTKLQALMLIKDTYAARLDLISNVDIVSRILEMAQKKRVLEVEESKEQAKIATSEHNDDTQGEEIEEGQSQQEQQE
jgi:hypothetical protein